MNRFTLFITLLLASIGIGWAQDSPTLPAVWDGTGEKTLYVLGNPRNIGSGGTATDNILRQFLNATNGTLDRQNTVTEAAEWYFIKSGDGYKIVNASTNTYLGTAADFKSMTATESEARTWLLISKTTSNGAYSGFAICTDANGSGAIDTSGNISQWAENFNDGGNTWAIVTPNSDQVINSQIALAPGFPTQSIINYWKTTPALLGTEQIAALSDVFPTINDLADCTDWAARATKLSEMASTSYRKFYDILATIQNKAIMFKHRRSTASNVYYMKYNGTNVVATTDPPITLNYGALAI